jgi:hypothetical protein
LRELTVSQLVAIAIRSDTGSHNRLDLIQSRVPPHYVCNRYLSMYFPKFQQISKFSKNLKTFKKVKIWNFNSREWRNIVTHMGNWMRISFSHYLTQTLFQILNLTLLSGEISYPTGNWSRICMNFLKVFKFFENFEICWNFGKYIDKYLLHT